MALKLYMVCLFVATLLPYFFKIFSLKASAAQMTGAATAPIRLGCVQAALRHRLGADIFFQRLNTTTKFPQPYASKMLPCCPAMQDNRSR